MIVLVFNAGDKDYVEKLNSLVNQANAMVAGTFAAGPSTTNGLTLVYSTAGNALTITVKQFGGVDDPSVTEPVFAIMRSPAAGAGHFSQALITTPLSIVVSSGSTLGHGTNDSRFVYVYLINNAGTLELAVSSKFYGLQGIVSTTAEGGAGAADSDTTMYSTAARSNVAFLCVGRFKAPQGAAGAWVDMPSSAEAWPFDPDSAVGDFSVQGQLTAQGIVDISGSGAGRIKFPAAQVPSADPNTFDDYEEGTFTAAFSSGSGSVTINNSFRTGAYIKLAGLVWLGGEFRVESVSTPGGALNLTGLPFTIPNGSQRYAAAAVHGSSMGAGATTALQGYGVVNTSTLRLEKFAAGATGDLAGDVSAATDFVLSLTHAMI